MGPYLVAADLLPVSRGRHLHVRPTGSDAQSGSWTRPWKTIRRAIEAATPGDTIHVAPGRYSDEWPDQFPSGTPEGTITLTATGLRARPVITAFPYFRGFAYWRLNRLAFTGHEADPASGDAAVVFGASSADGPVHHVELSQCVMSDFRKTGGFAHGILRKEGAHHIDILANTIRRIGADPDPDKTFHQHGMYMGQGHSCRLVGNLIQDIYAGYGIHFWGAAEDDVCAHNTISRTSSPGLTVGSSSPDGEVNGLLVELNRFRRTALERGGCDITNYNANGEGVVIRRNQHDGPAVPVDPVLHGGSTVEGAGNRAVAPVREGDVPGRRGFLFDPDPCGPLREALAAAVELFGVGSDPRVEAWWREWTTLLEV